MKPDINPDITNVPKIKLKVYIAEIHQFTFK